MWEQRNDESVIFRGNTAVVVPVLSPPQSDIYNLVVTLSGRLTLTQLVRKFSYCSYMVSDENTLTEIAQYLHFSNKLSHLINRKVNTNTTTNS